MQQFEGLARKTEADLNAIAARLEYDALVTQGIAKTAGEGELQRDVTPLKVLQAIQEIRAEHSKLVEEMEAIRKEQKEAAALILNEMQNLSQKLEQLGKLRGDGMSAFGPSGDSTSG